MWNYYAKKEKLLPTRAYSSFLLEKTFFFFLEDDCYIWMRPGNNKKCFPCLKWRRIYQVYLCTFNPWTANHNNCPLCHLLKILKVIFANSVDPDQTAPLEEQSDQGPHCLPDCKNRFEKFARIFSRRRKQTIFSDAGFLGILRVKSGVGTNSWLPRTFLTYRMHNSRVYNGRPRGTITEYHNRPNNRCGFQTFGLSLYFVVLPLLLFW